MTVFGAYARYYDLYYGDKDYSGEAAFIDGLIRKHGSGDASILEIGCGTGRHAAELALRGHRVHGIDLSEEMLGRAEKTRSAAGEPVASAFTFEIGDARTYRGGGTFDCVISLFHVMSYQTSNEDLLAAFTTAAEHLKPGGLFVFDCWYGPAVLTDRPARREKSLEDEAVRVTRIAVPHMDAARDVCEVVYDVTVVDKATGDTATLTESHPMRYLFSPEVELALSACGFDLAEQCEFPTGGPLSFDTWNGGFVARKRG